MNAAEARAKSSSNGPKLVDVFLAKAVTDINIAIKEAVNVGHFTTIKTLSLPIKLENEVIDRLETHYQELGYEVTIHYLFDEKLIQISWMY